MKPPRRRRRSAPRSREVGALLATILLLLPIGPTSAQDSQPDSADDVLARLLETHRYDLVVEKGRIGGPGGRVIEEAARAARFFLVGETHGVADMARFSQALVVELSPLGYGHLAIETSPPMAEELEKRARDDETRELVETHLRRARDGVRKMAAGDPSRMHLAVVTEEEIGALERAFASDPAGRNLARELAVSARIYRMNYAGEIEVPERLAETVWWWDLLAVVSGGEPAEHGPFFPAYVPEPSGEQEDH